MPETSVLAGSGSMSIRVEPKNRLAYTVRWERGSVTATDPEHMVGVANVEGVSGTLYRQGRPAATFAADRGSADKEKGMLLLHGHVVISAIDGSSVLKGTRLLCDEVAYATGDEIIKARGAVTVRSADATIGPFGELWCSNTLSEVASPGEFEPVRHNQPAKPQP